MTEYKTDTGMIYAVRKQSPGKYRIMCKYDKSRFGWAIATAPEFSAECNSAESLQEVLDAYAQRRGWAVYDPPEVSPTFSAAATAAAEEPVSPPAEQAPANTTAEPAAGGSEPEANALAEHPVTSELSQPAAFDYSGLDAQTVADLHLAEREYAGGKRMAEMGLRRMADGVAIAHDALCVTDATICRNGETGKFSKPDQAFGAWCESVGINRKAAERLLQVSKLFDGSSPRQQKVLEELSPSLLYAAAKPSAPAELVQAVKDGDITSHKQYQELLAQLKTKEDEVRQLRHDCDYVMAQRDAAEEHARSVEDDLVEMQQQVGHANSRAAEAEGRAKTTQRNIDQLKSYNESLRAQLADTRTAGQESDRLLKARIAELEARPIEVTAVDPDEVNRLAEEKAQALAAQRSADSTRDRDALQQRIEELEELLDDAAQDQIANTQALAVQAVETCESLMISLFGKILFLPDKEYLPAKRIVESFYAKLGWVLENDDWPDENDWALNHSGDESDDEPDKEEAEEDE